MSWDTKGTLNDGIPGHRDVTVTEWDYDRGGAAYAIRCECGKQLAREWTWVEALGRFKTHVAKVQSEDGLDLEVRNLLGQAMLDFRELPQPDGKTHKAAHAYEDWLAETARKVIEKVRGDRVDDSEVI